MIHSEGERDFAPHGKGFSGVLRGSRSPACNMRAQVLEKVVQEVEGVEEGERESGEHC